MQIRSSCTLILLLLIAAPVFAGEVVDIPSPTPVLADGGPILVCPPGKTHEECMKHNPLPPGGGS